jgi:hypothetical protein
VRRTALFAVALGLAVAGVARVPSPETPRPNVVLITLHTTRADHLGADGWKHARTPNLRSTSPGWETAAARSGASGKPFGLEPDPAVREQIGRVIEELERGG